MNGRELNSDLEAGETTALIAKPMRSDYHEKTAQKDNHTCDGNGDDDDDDELADLILHMFMANFQYSDDLSRYPKTNPKLPPVVRFKRHRNFYIFEINQFRHWWKTSRLLVRLSGGYEYCLNNLAWFAMGAFNVKKHKQAKRALKSMKAIGRGGVSREFLQNVHPFTRSVRLLLAIARGWEARVDNRFFEVLVAEAFAFMGNRCSRWIGRKGIDGITKSVLFPISAKFIAPYLDQNSRPVIVTMGFIRAILPFALSFQGSRFGRQLTFNTFKYANYRWHPVQSVMKFDKNAGVYQDMELDPELLGIAHRVAVAIDHGDNPVQSRENLLELGFHIFACGSGGHASYRQFVGEKVITLYITPYGPSILDEMPRYIILERRKAVSKTVNSSIINASAKPQAAICGFTYSGAYFQSQEWAALTNRYQLTLDAYERSCKILGTNTAMRHNNPLAGPPRDLQTLKEFIRYGNLPKKQRKDKKRWKNINREVERVARTVAKYQKQGTAPKQVIVYLEGLDCSAKSSTGGLVCSALEKCGYDVRTAQHNRPPNEEQKKKPWMDRGRFEFPEDVYGPDEEKPEYTALVWDRGPAGDFVYGSFASLNKTEKKMKYEEFRQYDAMCRVEDVLFIKLLFVADRDSIAGTLGKRLAHKKIARDLRIWLDANSIPHSREGLEEIEAHIDPTDFVAFNKYKSNLSIFTEFARNTNTLRNRTNMGSPDKYDDHWNVICTTKRYPARLKLLKKFEQQLRRYAVTPTDRVTLVGKFYAYFDPRTVARRLSSIVPENYVEEKHEAKKVSTRAIFQTFLLVLLLYFYAYITWKFDMTDYL
eukprot:CAMPEP_0178819250 /NCGR_PEP_ID=MMETSP0746-20121128/2870_1 /TAXON_ID=913974 /ORGANISM="Nitzschia punctata, Strain CCMP561" /LENGTH=819 /DNA_ID=CAMNT_0020480499 /DNA_START=138 /DNA_END=2597 /DNA_ORIENTATION=-